MNWLFHNTFGTYPSYSGHEKVVEALVEIGGADVDAKDKGGFTPLHLAVMKKFLNIVELLVRHHANVDATTNQQITPLHYAALNGNF